MNTPIVVCSVGHHPFDVGLSHQKQALRFFMLPELATRIVDAPVAFMRCGYEHELYDKTCLMALDIERRLKEAGTKIVNSTSNSLLSHRRDILYCTLKANGIPVPGFVPNPTIYEIKLSLISGEIQYPFVYRLADAYAGRGIFLVENEQQLESVHSAFEAKKFAPFKRTMAVNFVPDMEDGLFARARVYVVGGKYAFAARSVGKTLGVDRWGATSADVGCERQFMEANERWTTPAAIIADCEKASAVLGHEICSIDVLLGRGGGHYIVDVNPTYGYEPNVDLFPEKMRVDRLNHFEKIVEYLYSLAG